MYSTHMYNILDLDAMLSIMKNESAFKTSSPHECKESLRRVPKKKSLEAREAI